MDERLRALGRRAAEGDPAAEEHLLRRRVALGGLRRRRLRLAAYLGHPPAQQAFEQYLRPEDQPLDKWLRGIRHFGGPEAVARMLLALAEACVHHCAPAAERPPVDWSRPSGAPEPLEAEALVAAARDCLERPTRERAAALQRAICASPPSHAWAHAHSPSPTRARAAWFAVEDGAQVVATLALGGGVDDLYRARCVKSARVVLGEASLRRAVRRGLLPWALAEEPPAEPTPPADAPPEAPTPAAGQGP